jgi:hypothetical protein
VTAVSRRQFLGTSALAGIAGAAPSAFAVAAQSSALTRSRFAPLLDTAFGFRAPDGTQAQLTLVELAPLAQAHGYASPAQAQEWCFAARFRGDGSTAALDGLCDVTHPRLGRVALMVSPVGAAGDTWEAVFNRLR